MAVDEVPKSLTDALTEAQKELGDAERTVERTWMDKMKKTPGSKEVRQTKEKDEACIEARNKIAKVQYQIDEYKKYRKRELPPMHTGLYLNYKTFSALAQQLGKTREELQRVNGMVEGVFVYLAVRSQYLGERISSVTTGTITYSGSLPFIRPDESLTFSNFPVICLIPGSEINIKVTEVENGREQVVYEEANVKHTLGQIDRSESRLAVCSVFRQTGGMAARALGYTTKLELKLGNKIQLSDKNEAYVNLTIQAEDVSLTLRFTKPAGSGSSRDISPVGEGR
jgi:hypothetical protein